MRSLFILLLILPFSIYAQECKFRDNKKDEFTGAKIIETKKSILQMDLTAQYSVSFYSNDSTILLDLERVNTGGGAIILGKSDILILKIENDTLLKIFPADIYTSRFNGSSTILNARYILSKNQLRNLSDKSISSVRFTFNQNFHDIKVNTDRSNKIKNNALCVIKELN